MSIDKKSPNPVEIGGEKLGGSQKTEPILAIKTEFNNKVKMKLKFFLVYLASEILAGQSRFCLGTVAEGLAINLAINEA